MDEVVETVQGWSDNLKRNLTGSFMNMTTQRWIRLLVVLGAYALLRPFLVRLGARMQAKEHEKVINSRQNASAAPISPNSLRGQTRVPKDNEDEAEQGTGADWGKKARKRQGQTARKALGAEEKRLEEEDEWSDPDVSDLLMG
ncbi:MAG: hypothetical protein M1818_000186 [Claussenomyces sp. TS43310]|nr:MAG: hypothetical protein M1818_000186 [Claussenomyces sp. TS43310]